jgi:hypothetical protein
MSQIKFKKITVDIVGYSSYNKYMDRNQASQRIVDTLRRIDGRTSPWNSSYTFRTDVYDRVYDHDLFLEEINQFPCVMFTVTEIAVSHVGGGQRYNTMSFRLRGVVWDESTSEAGELLADDLEHAVSNIRQAYPEFEEIRLDTIQTDEGLNAPLGAVVIQGTAVYRND